MVENVARFGEKCELDHSSQVGGQSISNSIEVVNLARVGRTVCPGLKMCSRIFCMPNKSLLLEGLTFTTAPHHGLYGCKDLLLHYMVARCWRCSSLQSCSPLLSAFSL